MADAWQPVSTQPRAAFETDEWAVKSVRPQLRRSGWQRFAENVGEGVARSLAGVGHRAADAFGIDIEDMDRAGQPFLGAGTADMERELARRNRALVEQTPRGDATRFERERRAAYAARAAEDPADTVAENAQAAAGQILGSLASPESLAGVPGKGLALRMGTGAAVNAAVDTGVQGADIAMDVQDEWVPLQTVTAAAFGAAVPPVFDAAGAGIRAAGRAAAPAVRAAGRAAAPVVDAAGRGATRAADAAGRAAEAWKVAATERVDQFRSRMAPKPAASGAVPDLIRSIAAEEGIDPDFAIRVADIESRFDPKAQNPNSTAGGLYQFIDDTWQGLGGGDKTDATLNTRRFAELTRQNASQLESALGRQAEPWELYLAHQQGAGGARKLLTNPDARAADLVGLDAVTLNGGRPDMSAGEFAGLWREKYGSAGGPAVRGRRAGARRRGQEPIRWEVDADRSADDAASSSPPAQPRTDPLSEAFGALDERAGHRPGGAEVVEGASATWKSKDSDYPVTIRGPAQVGPDGRRYVPVHSEVHGSDSFVPFDELEFGRGPRPADRQTPDAFGAGTAAAGAAERPSVASGLRFIDANHSRLYDLGKRAEAGQVDADEAADLVRSMGRFLDLGDDARLSKRERQLWRSERFIYPRRMIEIARDFARQADAPENREAPVSYYDPDAYDAIMLERARTAEPDGAPLGREVASEFEPVAPAKLAVGEPPETGPHGPLLRGYEGRWAEATEALRTRGEGDAVGVLSHPALADRIDVPYGRYDPQTRKGFGYAKIAAEHPEVLPDLPQRLERMVLEGRQGNNIVLATPDGRERAVISTEVRVDDGVRQKTFLITAYERASRPDGSIGRRAVHEDPTLSSGRPETSSPGGGEVSNIVDEAASINLAAEPGSPRGGGEGGRSGEGTIDSPAADGPAVAAPKGSPDRPAGPKMRAEADGGKLRSSGVARSGLRHAPQPGAVRTADRKPYEGPTITELANRLRSTLGIIHRQGRVTGRRALGEYDTRTAVVRTKSMQEIDVIAHEAMHALEFKKSPALAAALKAHKAEVAPLDYDAMRGDIHEGFAEFGRWYITNPDVARRQAPKFYDAFEAAMEKDFPKALADLKAIQAAYRELLKTDSLSLAAASVAYTGRGSVFSRAAQMLKERGLRGAIQDALDKTYTALVDDLHPLSVTVRQLTELVEQHTGRPLDLKFAKNPYALARLARDSYGAGFVDVMDGVVPYQGVDPEGPSLAQALEKALGERGFSKWSEQRLRELDGYLIARRMRHEWQRYEDGELQRAPDKYSPAYHEAVIAQAERENPTWAEAAEIIYDWNSRLWQKEFDAGLITAETHAAGLEKVDYVPLNRDVSDKRGPGGGRGGRDMRFAGGAKRFKGSTRDVVSPLTSMMKRAYQVNALVKRNDVLKALDDLARLAGPGGGRFVERLPANEIERVQVDLREAFENAAKAQGLSVRDITTAQAFLDTILDPQAKASIFRQRGMEPKANEAVVFVWRDGKKIPLLLGDGEFGRELFSAIAGMNKEQQGVFMDVASSFTQALRLGVTLSPEFMARNIIRDQVATWINTDVGYIPGVSFVRGAVEQARQGPMAQRYAAAGGMRGGLNTSARNRPFPHTDGEARAMLQDLRKKGYRVRVYKPWTLKGLAAMTDLSETGTRLGVMSGAFKAAKKRGLDDYEAVTEAAYVARDYLDFGRRGSRMLSAVRLVTFLNAQIQGMDKAARVLTAGGNLRRVLAPLGKAAPRTDAERRALAHAYKAWIKLAALATFGGTLASLYADDPEYQEFGDRVRSTHWFFKKGEDWIAIPKPFELAIPSNIIEREILARAMEDPTQRTKMLTDLAYTLAPPTGIPAAEVPIQVATNRGYEGRPIVPDHLRGTVDPELQYNAFTSKVSRAISKAVGDFTDTFGERRTVSPAVIDHVITGFGGSLGRHGLQASDVAIEGATGAPRTATGPEDVFLARAFFRDAARGSSSQAEFWDAVSKDGGDLTRAEGSFRAHMRDGRDAEAIAYLNSLDPDERAYVQARVFSQDGTSKLHPLVRATEVLPVLSRLRQNVRDDELTTLRGQAIELTPDQRRRADDALSALAVAEMRNALVLAGHKGWENREMMKRQPLMDDLKAVDPRLPGLVLTLQDEAKIPRAPVMSRAWRQLQPRLEAPADESLVQRNMDVKRSRQGDRRARREQAIRMYQRREEELAQ